ncbi:hypothetical protein TI39_contig677g00006 [Zymoseptoria brevis]|uniref:Transcription factor tau subunit sfc1 n=1 Tax=Zymoseptoria brevis TaxID=1047168 RepID=A0A0F4GJD3_9PEZI|nr:hypothetical protein TI39_contig677g00006 [Zymoseptoria brevis]
MADGRELAPFHTVGRGRFVSIEHPSIIKNFERGFASLGGEALVKNALEHHVGDSRLSSRQNALPEPVVGVSLRPNDPLAKKIASTGIETRNILLKVTVPKRTGRKRKRGSDEPFNEPAQPVRECSNPKAAQIVRRLRDNADRYSVEAVGMVRETHRFRTLPDFQLRNADLPIMREIRDHLMVSDYDRLKSFHVDLGSNPSMATAFPGPPAFTSMDMPYKYDYEQAAGVVFEKDETGNLTSKNLSAPPRRLIWALAPDCGDDEIPQKPPMEIPRRSPGGDVLPRAIDELQKLMDERPLITKRVAINALPTISESIFKEATQYVGYSFRAGPWRDSLIRYGVDPRKDPKYRFYQTMMFQVDREAFKHAPESLKTPDGALAPEHKSLWARTLRHSKADPSTHIFDGKNITANGKTWQVCDVTDPVVHALFHTEEIRTECDVYQWGWYWNGTMSKARTIMKDKMRYLFAGQEPPEEDYKAVATIPNKILRGDRTETYLNAKQLGPHAASMSQEIRYAAKNGDNARALIMSAKARKSGVTANGTQEDGADADMIAGEDDGMNDVAMDSDGVDDGTGDFADMENQADAGAEIGERADEGG